MKLDDVAVFLSFYFCWFKFFSLGFTEDEVTNSYCVVTCVAFALFLRAQGSREVLLMAQHKFYLFFVCHNVLIFLFVCYFWELSVGNFHRIFILVWGEIV